MYGVRVGEYHVKNISLGPKKQTPSFEGMGRIYSNLAEHFSEDLVIHKYIKSSLKSLQ